MAITEQVSGMIGRVITRTLFNISRNINTNSHVPNALRKCSLGKQLVALPRPDTVHFAHGRVPISKILHRCELEGAIHTNYMAAPSWVPSITVRVMNPTQWVPSIGFPHEGMTSRAHLIIEVLNNIITILSSAQMVPFSVS